MEGSPTLDLLVLGAGVAGLSAAMRAAGLRMRVGVLTKADRQLHERCAEAPPRCP